MASSLKSKINTISFDLWGTLIRSNPQFKTLRNAILENYSYSHNDLDNQKNIADSKMDRLGVQIRREDVYNKAGIALSEEVLDEIDNAFILHPPIFMYDDLVSDLINLKSRGYKLTITSNTLMTYGSTLLKALPDLFDKFDSICFSDVVGCAKPNSKIFIESVGINNLSTAIHVGDNVKTDYDGALSCGIKPILVVNNNIEKIIKHEIFTL